MSKSRKKHSKSLDDFFKKTEKPEADSTESNKYPQDIHKKEEKADIPQKPQHEQPNTNVTNQLAESITRSQDDPQISSNTDVNSAVTKFLRQIKLPEIKSPIIQHFDITKIARPGSRILIVTEKPKAAQALAYALAGKNYKAISFGKKNKYYVLRYGSYIITIVPLKGHILEFDTHPKYKSWYSVDPIKIAKDPSALIVKMKYPQIARLLRNLAKKHDILIIATDADEEGENIGWEAAQIIKKVKNLPTYRMWFLSMQPHELKNAFLRPTKPITSWAQAPEARKIIDAFTGFAATRELTIVGRKTRGPLQEFLRNKFLSLGRVQSPTLYLIFLRERFIRNFKPQKYWSLSAILEDARGTQYSFKHIDSPFYQKELADEIYKIVQSAKHAKVISIETKEEKRLPEPPLNTNRALIMINKILGYPVKKAMKILEELYLDGLITYPRTDTDKYPPSYDHRKNLEKLKQLSGIGSYAREILSKGAKLTRNGRRLIGDHLPITPIDIPKKELPAEKRRVYELIVRRYLALFMEPAIVGKTKVVVDINNNKFVGNFNQVINEGFWRVYPYGRPKDTVGHFSVGQVLKVVKIQLREDKTKPPSRLSEGELLKLMEQLGLGTKATRAEHIQKLLDRGYVVRRGNKLYITELGYKLMEFLEKIWPSFIQPFFSAYVLELTRRIMNNEITVNEAVKDARKAFLNMFNRLRKSRNNLEETLSSIEEINIVNTRKRRASRSRRKRK